MAAPQVVPVKGQLKRERRRAAKAAAVLAAAVAANVLQSRVAAAAKAYVQQSNVQLQLQKLLTRTLYSNTCQNLKDAKTN